MDGTHSGLGKGSYYYYTQPKQIHPLDPGSLGSVTFSTAGRKNKELIDCRCCCQRRRKG